MPPANSIDELLEHMVERNASDLHVTTGAPPVIRVRGEVQRLEGYDPLTPEDTQQLLYRILSSEQQKHFELKRQLDFSHSIPGLARFRVNVYFQRESVGAAFRLIPAELKTLEELGIPPSLHQLAEKPRGLVLVTGPTGSGKSTTLAALIDEINRNRSEHILTIEDPIEFLHRHKRCIVNQREIGPDAKSFADALRAALRQDPDVILVPDDAVRNLIRQGKVEQIYSVMQTNTGRGMQTMEQSLAELIIRRVVELEVGLSRSSRPAQLVGLLERAGFEVNVSLDGDDEPAAPPPFGAGLRVAGS